MGTGSRCGARSGASLSIFFSLFLAFCTYVSNAKRSKTREREKGFKRYRELKAQILGLFFWSFGWPRLS